MMRDYSYSYQWDREYCYPESNVLINKLNIQDAGALHTAEREITSLRLAAAKMQLIKGKFDMKHLQKIHGYVFGDVYQWAGKLRHVDIAKGNRFCLAMNLDTYGSNLFKKLEQEHYLINSKKMSKSRTFNFSLACGASIFRLSKMTNVETCERSIMNFIFKDSENGKETIASIVFTKHIKENPASVKQK